MLTMYLILNVLKIFVRCDQTGCFFVSENHPITLLSLYKTKAGALKEFCYVPPRSEIERRLPIKLDKMFVASSIDALVCGHPDENNLVDLNRCKYRYP